MKYLKNNKFIIIFSFVLLFIALLSSRSGIIDYSYQRLLMANNPTTFFSCDKFKSEAELEKVLSDKNNEKVKVLTNYLLKNNGDIRIKEVGNRCPNKFEFEVSFGGDEQRVEIEKILENQTLGDIPVFLLNR